MYKVSDILTNEEYDLMYENCIKGYNNAYVPYSHFHVGASLLLNNGKIYFGCNIENSSYPLTCCAERTTMFKAVSDGYKKGDFKCIMVIGNTNDAISPCGACRQVMSELLGDETFVILTNLNRVNRVYKVKDLLPYSFSGDNLNE